MQVKCTSCGASQNISQAQNCDFCGNLIELESAKNKYQSFLNGESGNLMSMAETAVDATNWEEALQYYNKVLEKDISNSDAWLGKGIAVVYTSKISDIKTNEAIAYWKNAIKYAENTDAMSKRVAKEINTVVIDFYPVIKNHFIKFIDLENSFDEFILSFSKIDIVQKFASEIDQDNIEIIEKGYDLCESSLIIMNSYTSKLNKMGQAVVDDYLKSTKGSFNLDAQMRANAERSNYWSRSSELGQKSTIIENAKGYYLEKLAKLDPNHAIILDRKVKEEVLKKKDEENKDRLKNKEVNKKEGCFIATAAMGNYEHPVVIDLRLFRDNWLLEKKWGVSFTSWYYTHGPKAAKIIEKSIVLKKLTFLLIVKPLQIITIKFR